MFGALVPATLVARTLSSILVPTTLPDSPRERTPRVSSRALSTSFVANAQRVDDVASRNRRGSIAARHSGHGPVIGRRTSVAAGRTSLRVTKL